MYIQIRTQTRLETYMSVYFSQLRKLNILFGLLQAYIGLNTGLFFTYSLPIFFSLPVGLDKNIISFYSNAAGYMIKLYS